MSEQWTMPEWMEPYGHIIARPKGYAIQHIMHTGFNDRTLPCRLQVKAQIYLLERLHEAGMLGPVKELEKKIEELEEENLLLNQQAWTWP